MAAPGTSVAPPRTPVRAVPSDDSSAAAGVGALLAAAGLFGFQVFDALRVGSGPFFHASSVWWSRGWAVNMIVILLLAVCGLALVTRSGGFFRIPLESVFSHVHGGWNWALALGILFVTVAITLTSVALGDAPRAGWFVLGMAAAVLVWTGDSVSNVVLRARGYHPAPGFWLLVTAALLFVVAGIVQIQSESL